MQVLEAQSHVGGRFDHAVSAPVGAALPRTEGGRGKRANCQMNSERSHIQV